MRLADYVNEQPPSASIGDLHDIVQNTDIPSPIDLYQDRTREILRYGTPDRLNQSDMIGRLLALNAVSVTEAYFRLVMASTMEVCPIAQSTAAEKTINLGGMLWHGRYGFSRSAFDHISFASADDLRKASQSYLGFTLQPNLFQTPLAEFDKVCHLRHGIVHNDGLLPGRNAIKLDIRRFSGSARIVIQYRHLQDIASVTSTLVSTFNRELFEALCKRWAVDWRNRVDWEPSKEESLFNTIWKLFTSRTELSRRPDRASSRRIDCLRAVKVRFGLA